MITKKIWYILFLVGMLLLSGCTSSTQLKEESDDTREVNGLMAIVDNFGIQLQQEENIFVLSGISEYFNSLLVPEGDFFRILNNEKQGHLRINLKEMGFEEKEEVFNKDFSTLENIRAGLIEDFSTKEIQGAVLSKGLNKILVVDPIEKQIKVVNFKSNKITIIDSIDINQIKKPYEENIIFSPKEGFISIEIVDEKNGEGFISFGADSGKKIHDIIYGVEPSWSNGERSVAFLYRDGDKLGVYKTRSKDIEYLDELSKPNQFWGFPQWSMDDSTIYYRTGAEGADNIHLVRLKDGVITRIQDIPHASEVYYTDHQLVYAYTKENQLSNLQVIQLEGGGRTTYEDITPFELHQGGLEAVVSYLVLEEGTLYVKDNSVYLIGQSTTKCILKNKGDIKKVQFLADQGLLIFYIDGKVEQQLIFIFLQDLV